MDKVRQEIEDENGGDKEKKPVEADSNNEVNENEA